MKEYNKLQDVEEYDKEKVEELADVMNELTTLKARLEYLFELIEQNSDLKQFIWRTASGEAIPHHKIRDDHLQRIMTHILSGGHRLPKAIKAEARKRNIAVLSNDPVTSMKYLEGEVIDDDELDY